MYFVHGSMLRGHATGVAAGVLVLCGVSVAEDICVPEDEPTIQDAIDAATDGDEICVAPGTYNETIDLLGKAVRLYGTDGRDVTTIDATGVGGRVVTCRRGEGPDTILEGFTITGGNTSGNGGGMLNSGSSPTVTDCAFVLNTAGEWGGGMSNEDGSSPSVTSCTFSENDAPSGGAMFNWDGSNSTVVSCTFEANTARWAGGIYDLQSSSTVTDCAFVANASTNGPGGGMIVEGGDSEITGSTFVGNTAHYGGAMALALGFQTVTRCTFSENAALNSGGGLYAWSSGPTVTSCTFERNTAGGSWGGGVFNDVSTVWMTNCLLVGNEAPIGGGMCNIKQAMSTVTNCTFVANSATNGSGFASDIGPGQAWLTNCILWDGGDEVSNNDNSTIVVAYSNVQGGHPGNGNIDRDPLFVSASNRRLLPGSPCIDAADSDAVPESITDDLDGNPRFVDDPETENTGRGDPPIVDMGAYEFQVVDPCPADLDGDGDVGFNDLVTLLAAWGPCEGDCPADFDDSGDVGFNDLVALLASWGPCEQ